VHLHFHTCVRGRCACGKCCEPPFGKQLLFLDCARPLGSPSNHDTEIASSLRSLAMTLSGQSPVTTPASCPASPGGLWRVWLHPRPYRMLIWHKGHDTT
jgi:hypothetical protein